jgi:hypothetical protein
MRLKLLILGVLELVQRVGIPSCIRQGVSQNARDTFQATSPRGVAEFADRTADAGDVAGRTPGNTSFRGGFPIFLFAACAFVQVVAGRLMGAWAWVPTISSGQPSPS